MGQLPLWGLSLAERQERAFLEAGFRFGSGEGDGVVVREDVALTSKAVAAFVGAAKARGGDASWRCGGRAGELARQLAFGRDEPLLVYLAGGGEAAAERIAAAPPLEVESNEKLIELPVPRAQFGVDVLELPLTDNLVVPVDHWLSLLWANLLGLGPFLWRTLAGRNVVEVSGRLFWAAVGARSLQPARIGARLGRVGKSCRIHPSAVVEGCWLGDDVQIGAGAVVRGCVLAPGAAVEELALVEFSVLGQTARVQRHGMVKFSLLRQGAAASGAMQLGVLDRSAAVKYGCYLMDMTVGQGVRVDVGGRLVPAPLGLAGVCVGARTVLGAGVGVAPGRVLPPDLVIAAGADTVVRSVPDGLSGMVVVRNGRLEPA